MKVCRRPRDRPNNRPQGSISADDEQVKVMTTDYQAREMKQARFDVGDGQRQVILDFSHTTFVPELHETRCGL
jgi:hypothetical protein